MNDNNKQTAQVAVPFIQFNEISMASLHATSRSAVQVPNKHDKKYAI